MKKCTARYVKTLLFTFLLGSTAFHSSQSIAAEEPAVAEVAAAPIAEHPLQTIIDKFQTSTDAKELAESVFDARFFLTKNPISLTEAAAEEIHKRVRAITVVEALSAKDIKGEMDLTYTAVSPHFCNDYLSLLAGEPLAENHEYFTWLASMVFIVQESFASTKFNEETLAEKFYAYLPIRTTTIPAAPLWMREKAKHIKWSERVRQALNSADGIQIAYTDVQTDTILRDLLRRKENGFLIQVTPRTSEQNNSVLALFATLPDGECGWHALGETYQSALDKLLGCVMDERIYQSFYYEKILTRIWEVFGVKEFTNAILTNESFRKTHKRQIVQYEKEKRIKDETYTTQRHIILEGSPVPLELREEPKEVEAKTAWQTRKDTWLKENQERFSAWQGSIEALDKEHADSTWKNCLELAKWFRFPPHFLQEFITEDFARLYPGRQLQFLTGESQPVLAYNAILQRILDIDIYLWLDIKNPLFRVQGPKYITADRQLGLLSISKSGRESAKDMHLFLQGGLGSGHFSRLVPVERMIQVAQAIRHEQRYKLKLSTPTPVADQKVTAVPAQPVQPSEEATAAPQ